MSGLQAKAQVCFSLQPRHYSSLPAPNFQPTATQERDDKCSNQHYRRELLMMDIVVPETCWTCKKYNKIISSIYLVFILQFMWIHTHTHTHTHTHRMHCCFSTTTGVTQISQIVVLYVHGRSRDYCWLTQQFSAIAKGMVPRHLTAVLMSAICFLVMPLIEWVIVLLLGSSPYGPDAPRPWLTGPLYPISIQGSPVTSLKFQMAPSGNTTTNTVIASKLNTSVD